MIDVSIIILSYNTRELLRRCLRDAFAHTDSLSSEIIVVDNASKDGSADAVRAECPLAQCIETGRNLGYAGGNNVGIRASRGEFVLLLNSDAFLSDGALRAMVEHLRHHPKAGVVGPRLCHEDGSLHLSCRHFPTVIRHATWATSLYRFVPIRRVREYDWLTDFAHDEPRQIEMLSGACWMLRRSMLDQIGLLNERLFLYAEEFDLCWRAAQAGWQTWFVPAGPVMHAGGKSSGSGEAASAFTSFHRYRSGYLTMRWHRGKPRALMAAGIDQALLSWRLAKNRLLHPDRTTLLESIRQALRCSRRAAVEMWKWREESSHAC